MHRDLGRLRQGGKGAFFLPGNFGILRVAEKEQAEPVRAVAAGQRVEHGAGIAEHNAGVFVVDRDQKRHVEGRTALRGLWRTTQKAHADGADGQGDPDEGDPDQRQ